MPKALAHLRAPLLIGLALFLMGGCTSQAEHIAQTVEDVQAHGMNWRWLHENDFDIATATTPMFHGQTLWVFLEGDGFAYVTPTQPSTDPTPKNPIGLQLALAEADRNNHHIPVAWLARPCQYAFPSHAQHCSNHYWTDARYAPEIIADVNAAIAELKNAAGATHIILVGYSGGGSLAALIAANRQDIAALVTIGANLDIATWVARKELSPLTASLNPADVAIKTAAIPQWHFIGSDDDHVDIQTIHAFTDRLPVGSPVHVIEMPGYTHSCCWVDAWPDMFRQYLQEPIHLY